MCVIRGSVSKLEIYLKSFPAAVARHAAWAPSFAPAAVLSHGQIILPARHLIETQIIVVTELYC